MTDLPAPLTPPESDLQSFAYMPLHVARLRDSDLAAEEEPEACWYAVLLWAASWHQLPAGSLPDNDTVLMRLVGLGRDAKTWKKHRSGALRGFVKCSDGRMYHPVVAEQVADAWQGRLEQRHRTECARIKKHNQRNVENEDMQLPVPTFEDWLSRGQSGDSPERQTDLSSGTAPIVPRETPSKGEGEGEGEGEGDSKEEDKPPIISGAREKFELPEDIPTAEWAGFVEMRRRIGKPMTPNAMNLAVARLRKLRDEDGWPPGESLNNSTLNSYQGIFPPSRDRRDERSSTNQPSGIGRNEAAAIAVMRDLGYSAETGRG